MQKGFSLLELSIVLVIIGLLAGGVTLGRHLIRAAELKSVPAQLHHYYSATLTFKHTYTQLPGDISNAESFWHTMSTGTCPDATAGVGTETCNGNGDGRIDVPTGAGLAGENFAFWKHLSNSGMITGQFTGVASSGSLNDSTIGVNVPRGKLHGAGVSVDYVNLPLGWAGDFPHTGHRFWYGAEATNNKTFGHILSPIEVHNMDKKIDDANPGTGKIQTWRNLVMPDCTTSNGSLSAVSDAQQARYRLDRDDINTCAFLYVMPF